MQLEQFLTKIDLQETPLQESESYYVLSSKWLKFLQKSIQEKSDLNKMPNLNQELVQQNQKDIIPLSAIDDQFLRNDAKLKYDYKCITQDQWNKLIQLITEDASIPKTIFKFQLIMLNEKLKCKYSQIKLLPLYEGVTQFIEGIQRFDREWTPQQAIDALELALQEQLLIQVPKRQFIKLYTIQENITSFNQLVEKCKAKSLSLIEITETMNKYDETYLIIDIKGLNKDYYFSENKVIEYQDSLKPECDDLSKKGLSLFEEQKSLTSCLLKCYENVDKIRNFVNLNAQYTKLNSIIQQSYTNYLDITYYNHEDVQYLQEIDVQTSLSRNDIIYVKREPIKVILTHKKTLKQLAEELLPNIQSYYFECSNQYYTEKINLDIPSNQLPLGYVYNLNEAQTGEELIEVTIHRCIIENDGILQSYQNFDVIRTLEISNNQKFQELHLAIANLYDNIDIQTYKNEVVNKQFELVFKTSQINNEKCIYCDQKLCNNCIVPYVDKKISLKSKKVQIYAIYQTKIPKLIEQPIYTEDYKLEDFYNFEIQTEETLILNINQPHPYLLQYPLKYGNYQLEAIIEKITNNEYNCYCKRGDKWISFNNLQQVEISDKLNAVKLFYCRID